MFPISARKCKIFPGIYYRTELLRSPAFFLPPKLDVFISRQKRQLRFATPRPYLLTNDFFFFEEQHQKGKCLCQRKAFFFWRKPKFEQEIVATDQECLKSSGILTLSSERSHYFWHLRSWRKVRGNTDYRYQSLRLKYCSISPSPNYFSLLNIDKFDYSL